MATIAWVLVSLISITVCSAQQTISVRNAAGFSGPVAPGSIIDIRVLDSARVINPDPSHVSVEVLPAGASAALDAPLLAAPFLSIWALLPAETPVGPAQVILTVDGQASAPASITVAASGFGVFTQSLGGLGPALAQNQDVSQAPVLNGLTRPVLPDQYMILWGTGLGSAGTGDVTIQLGGRDIAPSYAGPAPGYSGLDQINFRVPADLGVADGCYVSLIVKAGAGVSNQTTVAKAGRAGACEHPLSLSAGEMGTLDAGGRILFGTVRLLNDSPGTVSASAQFLERANLDIALLAQPLLSDDRYFGCSLTAGSGALGAIFVADIDAGDTLSLTGPDLSLTVPRQAPGSFYGLNLDVAGLAPGTWQIAGPGGKAIGPFQAALTLPPPLRGTNLAAAATVDRHQDRTVTWDPSGYSDGDVAIVTIGPNTPSSYVLCRTPAQAGNLILPANLLGGLPTGPATMRLSIGLRPDRRTLFSMPLTNGSTARGLFEYSFSESISTLLR